MGPPFRTNKVKIAEDGEILIKGENVMLGYWNLKEETDKVIKDGWLGDTSRMSFVGTPAPHAQRLVEVTQECLIKGIEAVGPNAYLGDIGSVIQTHAEQNYYSVVREYCGHGIGSNFHEEPQVLHYGIKGTGAQLKEGMTFTIEPMLNAGKSATKLKSDGWTVETKDGRLSAQWEHTIVVTENGSEILTK